MVCNYFNGLLIYYGILTKSAKSAEFKGTDHPATLSPSGFANSNNRSFPSKDSGSAVIGATYARTIQTLPQDIGRQQDRCLYKVT